MLACRLNKFTINHTLGESNTVPFIWVIVIASAIIISIILASIPILLVVTDCCRVWRRSLPRRTVMTGDAMLLTQGANAQYSYYDESHLYQQPVQVHVPRNLAQTQQKPSDEVVNEGGNDHYPDRNQTENPVVTTSSEVPKGNETHRYSRKVSRVKRPSARNTVSNVE